MLFENCKSGLSHVVIPRLVQMREHEVHGREEYRLSPSFDIFSTRNQSWQDDGMHVVGTSNVVDLLGKVAC